MLSFSLENLFLPVMDIALPFSVHLDIRQPIGQRLESFDRKIGRLRLYCHRSIGWQFDVDQMQRKLEVNFLRLAIEALSYSNA